MKCSGITLFLVLLFAGSVLVYPRLASADTASDIQAQIDANQLQRDALDAEIAVFQKQIDALGAKKSTLQSTISSLSLSQQQLTAKIKVTQNKIASANLQINKLSLSIGDKEESIATNHNVVAKQLRSMTESEQIPFVATLISSATLSDAWQTADQAIQFNQALTNSTNALHEARTALATNRDQISAVKTNLVSLQKDLSSQKRSVDAGKAAQQQLLTQTKNQEANYQKIVAQKKAAEKAAEQELIDLQGQLNLIVHPGLLPKTGRGIISWPFSDTFMLSCARLKSALGNPFCITQYFGNTAFATANPQLYKGKGHNGMDIGVPIGTPVQAALGGIVLGTGNTDLAHDAQGNQCWSFGKWIMIKHGNGLSTMYSHLSVIDVSIGQSVNRRQVIGLSGMTGSATGPHIHFGVYATEGTEIMNYGTFKNVSGTRCASAVMPVAKLDAYLNPLSYL